MFFKLSDGFECDILFVSFIEFTLKNSFSFRLSPLYLMVGLLTEIFTSYIVDVSKFWVHDRSDLNCQRYGNELLDSESDSKTFISPLRYWWRNLLYINNLFEHNDLCMNWTWSMACEMQFFLVFTIILFIYAK